MGCDIHGVFQRRVREGWEDVPSRYEFNRHYYLFAALAGVRDNWDLQPIAEARGLPEGFAMEGDQHPIRPEVATEFEKRWNEEPVLSRWMGDYGYGWLMSDEMLASPYATDEKLKYFFDEVYRLQTIHGPIRFVFGFDN